MLDTSVTDKAFTKTCPACESDQRDSIESYNEYRMRRCRLCNFVWCEKRSIDNELYEGVYEALPGYQWMKRITEQTANGNAGFDELWRYKRLALKRLERNVKSRKLLDVGCGPGQFLLIARQRGWTVAGVELAHAAAQQARSYDLDLFEGRIDEFASCTDTCFSAVTCFEVLEHVPDPVEMLLNIRRLLDGDGLLVISVPNSDDRFCLRQDDPASMPPIHLNFFNRRSLQAALTRAGFETTWCYTLPIPTNSARRCLGRTRYWISIPWLLALRILGKSDGTTLLAVARPKD